MADNTQLNSGTGGDIISTDDLGGGVKVQRVKVQYGLDGAATDVSGSNPLPVVQTGTPALPTGAATEAKQDAQITHEAAIRAAVEIVDDWDESDRAKVNPIVGQAGVAGGAGAVSASTQRTTLATDDPAVASLAVMDDWDEADRAKVNIVAGQAGVSAGAGAVAANTPRVTLASDDPAVASLGVLDDWDESDRAKVNPIVGQTGVQGGSGAVSNNTQRVVLATDVALPAGTNGIGNVGLAPRTAGGHTIHRTISAASTNATNVKGSAGQLYGYIVSNINAAPRYLKLYNKATAPTVGSDTPVMTILIPGNTSGVTGHIEFTNGIEFPTGIGFALTSGVADADTGAVAANEQVVHLFYK